jgi:acyl-CoA reductase-like NAD-dependent aldehyde dehydrogenase
MAPSRTIEISFTKFHNIVDGQPRDAQTYTHGIDPTTGSPSWDVPVATEQDLNDAVKAAEKAFETWSQVSLDERKEKLKAFLELYQGYTEELTNLLIKESGKPVGHDQRSVLF